MTLNTLFTCLRDLKKLKRMSLGSKYGEINDFYKVLNAFINTHEATTTETKVLKTEFWIMSNNFTINTSTLTKKYDSEKVKDKEKKGCVYKQFE